MALNGDEKMRPWLWIWIVLVVSPVLLWAQETRPGIADIDSIVNPSLLGGKEILCFDTTEQPLGNLSEDDAPVAYQFRYRNVSGEAVVVTHISASCGCTTAMLDKKKLEPGGEGILTLIFNPSEQAGTVYKTAFIYTTLSAQKPVAKIALSGVVRPTANRWADYPYFLGNSLRTRQAVVRFRDLLPAETRTERVVCINSGEKPLKLSALLCPSYAKFRTEPAIIAPGEEADLIVTVEGGLLPGFTDDGLVFTIVVDGLAGRPSDRTLQVNVSLKKE